MGWLRRKWAWANDNRLFWAHGGLAVISLLIFLWPGASDLRIRLWGMVLQLLGVFTVWLDLTSTARKFGKGGFVRHTLIWLHAFFRQNVVIEPSTGAMNLGRMRVQIKSRRTINPNAPVQERLAALEANIGMIYDGLDSTRLAIDKRAEEADEKIKTETEMRDQSIHEVKASLEDATVGNLAALAFGAAWLAIGVVLATLAPEIVKVFSGQWEEVWRSL